MGGTRRFLNHDEDRVQHRARVCEVSGIVDCASAAHKADPCDLVTFEFGRDWFLEQIHSPQGEDAPPSPFTVEDMDEIEDALEYFDRDEWFSELRKKVAAHRAVLAGEGE